MRKKKKPQPAEKQIYHLHIDAAPVYAHSEHKHGRTHSHAVFHTHMHSGRASRGHTISRAHAVHGAVKHSHLWTFIWDKIQFALVSIFVFMVIYVVLNWSALQANLVHYWNVWRGFESPLEELVAKKELEPEKLPIASRGAASEQKIPPLNLEIYPPEMRLIVPRINQNVPVIGVKNENLIAREWGELEADIQKALRNGVIHYPGTALPGDNGNVVITGHSSYYAWDSGRFKDVFALLHDVRVGDRIVIYFNQKKFVYEIANKKVVLPQDVDVLQPTRQEQLTLITCTPIGTNLKRLILEGKLVEKN